VQAADLLAYGISQEFPDASLASRQNGPFRGLFSPCDQKDNPFEWEHWDAAALSKHRDMVESYRDVLA
jgi:hypothetical protein